MPATITPDLQQSAGSAISTSSIFYFIGAVLIILAIMFFLIKIGKNNKNDLK
jgi:uncharacterized membrane protein